MVEIGAIIRKISTKEKDEIITVKMEIEFQVTQEHLNIIGNVGSMVGRSIALNMK